MRLSMPKHRLSAGWPAFKEARGWDESATIQFSSAGFTSLITAGSGFSGAMPLAAA